MLTVPVPLGGDLMQDATIAYDWIDPTSEGLREALTSTGNGYFCTRGTADGPHLAALYQGVHEAPAGPGLSRHRAGRRTAGRTRPTRAGRASPQHRCPERRAAYAPTVDRTDARGPRTADATSGVRQCSTIKERPCAQLSSPL